MGNGRIRNSEFGMPPNRLNHRGTEGTEPHRGFPTHRRTTQRSSSSEVMIFLCGFSVFSVPLWFNRSLESFRVNDSGVAMPRSRRLLAATDAATDAALGH
jgi:hypothetical protein